MFSSDNWETDPKGFDGLGEVANALRVYADGTPAFPVKLGAGPCGTADQFLNGVARPPDPPTPLNLFGGLACCPLPTPPFVHLDCVNCPDGSYSDYILEVSGVAGAPDLSPVNGTWRLRYIGSCTWESPAIPLPAGDVVFWRAIFNPVGELNAFIDRPAGGPAYVVYRQLAADDCLASRVVPFQSKAFITTVAPPTVALLPGIPNPDRGLFCPALGDFTIFAGQVRFGPAPGLLDRIAPGHYPLTNNQPCFWTGQARLVNAVGRTRAVPVTLTLQIGPTRILSLVVEIGGAIDRIATYLSTDPWDQVNPVTLMLAAGPGGFGISLPMSVIVAPLGVGP